MENNQSNQTNELTLAQAFKLKNRLINEYNVYLKRIEENNSMLEGNERIYDPKTQLNFLTNTQNDLIKLKTSISKANLPILEKIYRMNELKSMVSQLKMVITTEGFQKSYRDEPLKYTTSIGKKEMDEIIHNMEFAIETIQDELDEFNHKTTITL